MSEVSVLDLLAHCTKAVRAADEQFEREGGSSRHWVRDCFLPALEAEGLCVRPADDRGAVSALRDAIAAVSGPVRHMPSPTYTPQVSVAQVERWKAALDQLGGQ